jgi:hypothetical protein
MQPIDPDQQERQRRVLEARARLREGYTTRDKVAELMRIVAAKRGQAAAEQLRVDMREQWRTRSQWMTGQGTGPTE